MMRITAHVDTKATSEQPIVIRKTMHQNKMQHRAGTVLMTDVHVGGNLRGTLVEEHERQFAPKQTIAQWSRLRYITSKGYVDSITGEKVERAKAVYMVGTKAYYLPSL